jgi:hypothetical protein
MKSGFAFKDPAGEIDLVFSDQDGICDSVKAAKLHAGEMLVQSYSLIMGPAPGEYTSDDIKFAVVSTACPSGTPVGQTYIAASGRATSSAITISAISDSNVTGTVSIQFEQNSSIQGSFDVPTCSATTPESSVCY